MRTTNHLLCGNGEKEWGIKVKRGRLLWNQDASIVAAAVGEKAHLKTK